MSLRIREKKTFLLKEGELHYLGRQQEKNKICSYLESPETLSVGNKMMKNLLASVKIV